MELLIPSGPYDLHFVPTRTKNNRADRRILLFFLSYYTQALKKISVKVLEYPRRFIDFLFTLSRLFNNRSYELRNSFPEKSNQLEKF